MHLYITKSGNATSSDNMVKGMHTDRRTETVLYVHIVRLYTTPIHCFECIKLQKKDLTKLYENVLDLDEIN